MTQEEFINEYIKLASYETNYASGMSVKKHNKNLKELDLSCEKIKNNPELEKTIYTELLKNENLKVLLYASVDCLKLHIYTRKAKKILKKISKMKDIGILSLEAETCLKIYKGKYPGKSFN